MSKLWIFEMTQHEKVLFLDSEMYVNKRMDGIFTDETTKPLPVNQTLAVEDEGTIPESYIFSA